MSTASQSMTFLEELTWRGLLHQTTSDGLSAHLQQPRIGYAGFDPTADSLTIGNLVPIMMLAHFQRAGHTPVVIMGGGTGLIGDPSGKERERALRGREEIEANINSQRRIFEQLLDCDSSNPNAARIINNIDWLERINYIDLLRDIGKHFSVNMMIQKESIKARLETREHGISYTEFSYLVLQAYDFLHLHRELGCTVQLGGSDQYGNIVAGVDLIRRVVGGDSEDNSGGNGGQDARPTRDARPTGAAFGLTAPLVTRSDGGKFGKTEAGSVWLTPERTSPYAFYQFWLNTSDDDAARYLRIFTTLDRERIESILAEHENAPHKRAAQRALAEHVTEALHGEDELGHVQAASEALFGGDVCQLSERMLAEVFADVASSTHDKASLQGGGFPLVELLPQTPLADSKRQAREFLGNGAVYVNGETVKAERTLRTDDLLHGHTILLRRGKKNWHATKWG